MYRKKVICIGHQNLRSYNDKFPMVLKLVTDYNLDVFCLTETWFKEDSEYCVPDGYKMYRKDRLTRGGGVAIIVRKYFKVRVMNYDIKWLDRSCVEYLILKVQINHRQSIIVCVIYKPDPCLNDLRNIQAILSFLNTMSNQSFILGDFNVNMLVNSSESKKMISLIDRHNYVQLIKMPTRDDSLLDFVIVKDNQVSKIIEINVSEEGISDHRFCFCKVKVCNEINRSKQIKKRNYKSINFELFVNDMVESVKKLPFDGNCNILCHALTNNILSVFDRHAPIETTTVKLDRTSTRVSKRTQELIQRRDFHYNLWKKSRSTYDFCEFKILNKSIRNSLKVDTFDNTQRLVNKIGPWDTLKLFGLRFGKIQGEIGANISLDQINQYYCSMGFPEGVAPFDTVGNFSPIDISKSAKFLVKSVSTFEIVSAWKGLKHKSSKFPDTVGMSMYMLGLALPIPHFRDSLVSVFKKSFSSGRVPDQLKCSRVVPIPKISNATKPDEFRPITLTPYLLLLMEKVFSNRLEKYLDENKILCRSQFGFRKYHSTEHLGLGLTDLIRLNLDKGMVCVLITVDFKKAFDSVHRGKLLQKLHDLYGISDHWLRDYLSDRKRFVDVDGKKSKVLKTMAGVPAGSILGPRLFSLYINDMPKALKYALPNYFADDSTFAYFGHIRRLAELQNCVNEDMNNIVRYTSDNSLSLHDRKTKMLLLGSRSHLSLMSNFNVTVSGVTIVPCDRLKCVGLTIDSRLSWRYHIDDMAKRAYFRIRSLYTVRQYFTQKSLITIGVAVVISILNYMSCVWGVASQRNLIVAERVIRSLARLVLRKRKFDPVSSDIKLDLNWLFPKDMSIFRTLCIMYKIVKLNNVPFFDGYFCKLSEFHNHMTRGSSNNNFRSTMKPRTEFGRNSFNFRGILLWNSLPNDIKDELSYVTFKNKLRTYLLMK